MELINAGFSMERSVLINHNLSFIHIHQEYELYFLLAGQRRYFLEDTVYDVAPGNLVFIPRTVIHKTVSLGNRGSDRYVAYFSQEHADVFAAASGKDILSLYPKGGCFQFPPDKVHQIKKYFERIAEEQSHADEWSQASCIFTLHNILLTSFRHGTPISPVREETVDNIQKAARYISIHYSDLITLTDVSNYVHMEKTYFSKRFKAVTGFGFLDYLTQTRLRKAEELLAATSLSIGEISDACGFSGPNYFGDVFRRYYQISPTEFRLRSQKK